MNIQRRTLLLTATAGAAATLLAACGGGDDPVLQKNIVATAQGGAQFSTLVAAVVKADLVNTLSNAEALTVFAPTNAAFDAAAQAIGLADGPALVAALPGSALAKVLTYHVVAGKNLSTSLVAGDLTTLYTFETAATKLGLTLTSGVQLTDAVLTKATVTTADIQASNGVIHEIDKLLVPPGVLNIVQMAQLNPAFSTLVGAVVSANLVDALDGPEVRTVFAPLNSAFVGLTLPTGMGQLAEVLTYHVLGSQVLSTDLGPVFGVPVPTLAGQNITINNNAVSPNIATITDASGSTPASNIVAVDVRASNGVIHVIDKVLIPVIGMGA